MCYVSKAISPPFAWAATKLGEWYWNELPQQPGPWHLGPDDDDEDDNLSTFREFFDAPPKETASSKALCKSPLAAPQAAPHRAPPRDRAASIGTTTPHPAARVLRPRMIENAMQLTPPFARCPQAMLC